VTQPPANLVPALAALQRGDRVGARAAIDAALATEPDAPALLAFGGLLAAQSGDAAGAIPYLRRAIAAAPDDLPTRINLATALLATGAQDEAGEVAADGGGDPRLLRIAGYVRQQQGRLDEAAAAYDAVVAAFPDDFESWNNLGNVRIARGDPGGAVDAYQAALDLRPDLVPLFLNVSEALAQLERNEDRRRVIRQAAALAPGDAQVMTELGLAESALQAHAEAEAAFRAALRADPRFLSAYLELGLLLENLNRVDELTALIAEAEANDMVEAELGFLKAWGLRRQGRFAEAQPLAEAIPPTINPVRRARLIAEIADRLGQTERAFQAYAEMNEMSLATRAPPPGLTYRAHVERSAALLTPEWRASWRELKIDLDPPSPIFLVGFPRSGTTLLDTLLMNMPELHVLEELPVMSQVDVALGDEARLATLDADEANRLRQLYFETLAGIAPPASGKTIVDKHPLRMARMPIVHRLFPDARIIFVERHPCDAVLSCFMANFQLNPAMRSFTDLEEAARTYDAVFTAWTRAEALFPLRVRRVRYEHMVEDLGAEMRPLLEFLGLPWDEKVLDNQAAAASRGHVRTASYAQVTEPIYKRAAGRWERYRAQLEPILPILAPWAEKMGYGPLDASE
jgi:tetratricopeptide (TPR) repeat protein